MTSLTSVSSTADLQRQLPTDASDSASNDNNIEDEVSSVLKELVDQTVGECSSDLMITSAFVTIL